MWSIIIKLKGFDVIRGIAVIRRIARRLYFGKKAMKYQRK